MLRVTRIRADHKVQCWRTVPNATKSSRYELRGFSTINREWRLVFEEQLKRNNFASADWYQVQSSNLDETAKQILTKDFKGSLYTAVSSLFPEIEWYPWKFRYQPVPPKYWKEQSNQRKFFDDLGKQIGIQTLDDWYELLSKQLIHENGGMRILELNNGSVTEALMASYPEHNWIPWRFNYTPHGFWNSIENQRKYFDWLGKEFGVQQLDDWYQKLSRASIQKNGGARLLMQYHGVLIDTFVAAYPEHTWDHTKFKNIKPNTAMKKPPSLTDQALEQSNQPINELKGILEKKSHLTDDEWYQVSIESLDKKAAEIIKTDFHGSLYRALSAVFPRTEWLPWKFKHQSVPPKYWKQISNQRKFFDDLGKQIGIKTLDDWYEKLTAKEIQEYGGSRILRLHNSPVDALMTIYPEHRWIPTKFHTAPTGYWKSLENQKKFFDGLSKSVGVTSLDDWYEKLSHSVIREHGGGSILKFYNGSATAALMANYPEHRWCVWKFKKLPVQYWSTKDNINAFLSELSEKLSIQTLDDWYRVDTAQLRHFGAWSVIVRHNGLYNLLKEQYPHHPWDAKRFTRGGKKAQRWLAVTLKKMFPNEEILEDYMHPKAVFPTSNRAMQLDVFIPSKNLAFEYQGIQHYQNVGIFSPTKQYQQRDEEKRNLCAANNIQLIEVPYWWNRTQKSLKELMKVVS